MNKIGFIGGGKMASAIIKGIINSNLFLPSDIYVSAKTEKTLNSLKNNFGVNTTSENIEVVKNTNIIILAVKPFVVKSILEEIKSAITDDKLIISIAAGISINSIEKITGNIPIIRVMPNTPALVNEGMSAICSGKFAKEENIKITSEIFNKIGKVINTNEKYIDIVTAISGSGPAFYYYIIDEIAKSGEKLGLDYKTCLQLSAQTALGAAKMILDTQIPPNTLIENVTTPGGCTEQGNNVLIKRNVSDIINETITKTMEKAKSLG